MRPGCIMVTAVLFACVVVAQQPNSSNARMTIDAVEGPPFPIQMNVRTSSAAIFQIQGGTNVPFVIVGSAQGNVAPGAATYFGNHFDLPLTPTYVICLNGITNPVFTTDMTGQFSFPVMCPPPGNPPNGIPLGFHAAYQAAMVDYFNSFGWSLTAATRVTVTQGPTVVYLNLPLDPSYGVGCGPNITASVNLATFGIAFPFYGVNYNVVHISGDGYMTFGGSPVGDYTASDYDMNNGPPRIAGFWTDLEQASGQIIRYTVDPNPPGGSPYLLVEFLNVGDAICPTSGSLHSFAWKIDTLGVVTVNQLSTNNPSIYDVLVGIGPGNGLNPQTPKNLSALLLPSSYFGAVNESFYEWFGIVTLNPYYTLPVDDPYDLPARTLNFLPSGSGTMPGYTNRYLLY